MKNKLTEIVFILDRSGSMSGLVEEAVAGFNELLRDQKAIEGEANLTLHLFNDQHEYPVYRKPIQQVERITFLDYNPSGATALYDAIGLTTDKLGEELAATPEAERPEKVIIAIFTDGMENRSGHYSLEELKELITTQQNVYSWEYLFLSSDLNSYEQSLAMGISKSKVAYTDKGKQGYSKAASAISKCVAHSRTNSDAEASEEISLQERVDTAKG